MNDDFTCDTIKLSEDSKAIYNLAIKYINDIYDFYKLFDVIVNDATAWKGQGAKAFYQKTLSEKGQYDEFGNGIKKLADEMGEFANNMEAKVLNSERLFDDPVNSADIVSGG